MRSTLGVGTLFSLTMAADLGVTATGAAPHRVVPPLAQRARILIVDDEPIVRDGMRVLLEELNFEVHVAASTTSALSASSKARPDVVLADLRLRGDDSGIQTIWALRSADSTIRALLISGDTAPERLREAHDAGITMLHKPVSAALLKDSIQMLLSRST